MKSKLYTALMAVLVITITNHVQAQNTFPSSGSAGIGTTAPNASSLLEVKSTTKGILIPRMTQVQRNAIKSPATSLLIYVTDVNPGFYFYSGTAWVGLVAKNTGWLLKGNSSLDSASNFIGTTDNGPFSIRTKNVERMHVSSTGNVGIGVSSPAALLHINGGGAASLTNNGYVLLGKTNNYNLAIDNEQLQARDNGSYSDLYLNKAGGTVYAGDTLTSDSGLIGYGESYGLYGYSPNEIGVFGSGGSYGVEAHASNGSGVFATGNIYGIYASASGSSGAGVYGTGSSYGVQGNSSNGTGVYGISTNGTGVSGSGTNTGVFGSASGSGSIGLYGTSPNIAVYGLEDANGTAVYGVDEAASESDGNGTGVAGRSYTGYGVSGSAAHGYGVYGNSENYAGYFDGDVYTAGIYTSSDATLKQNITDVSSAMTIISQLKPKYYNFRSDGNYQLMNLPKGKHYGLIAQDVEKVLPGLVKETKFDAGRTKHMAQMINSKDSSKQTNAVYTKEIINFKALNYTELIPIVIKGMQELQDQNEQLKNISDSLETENALLNNRLTIIEAKLGISNANTNTSASVSSASLQQNIPNPFSSATTIGYNLPSNYSSANIIVTDAKGVVLKQISLNAKGKGNVQLDASTLASGAYRYSLYIDGKMIDSKQMISSK